MGRDPLKKAVEAAVHWSIGALIASVVAVVGVVVFHVLTQAKHDRDLRAVEVRLQECEK